MESRRCPRARCSSPSRTLRDLSFCSLTQASARSLLTSSSHRYGSSMVLLTGCADGWGAATKAVFELGAAHAKASAGRDEIRRFITRQPTSSWLGGRRQLYTLASAESRVAECSVGLPGAG